MEGVGSGEMGSELFPPSKQKVEDHLPLASRELYSNFPDRNIFALKILAPTSRTVA